MDDWFWGFLIGVVCSTAMSIVINSDGPDYRTEICTLAFSHAETRLDSLEVTVTYDYCEVDDG